MSPDITSCPLGANPAPGPLFPREANALIARGCGTELHSEWRHVGGQGRLSGEVTFKPRLKTRRNRLYEELGKSPPGKGKKGQRPVAGKRGAGAGRARRAQNRRPSVWGTHHEDGGERRPASSSCRQGKEFGFYFKHSEERQ